MRLEGLRCRCSVLTLVAGVSNSNTLVLCFLMGLEGESRCRSIFTLITRISHSFVFDFCMQREGYRRWSSIFTLVARISYSFVQSLFVSSKITQMIGYELAFITLVFSFIGATHFSWIKYSLKVIVTVFSSGCLQIGFGVLIIDYICNFLIWPP